MRRVRDLGRLQLAGVVVLATWVLWSTASAVRADWGWAPALPYLLCPVVLAAGVGAGSALGRRADAPGTRVGLPVAAGALVLGALLATEPGKAPLGYPNANAALAVQLLALCGLSLLSASRLSAGRLLADRHSSLVGGGCLLSLVAVALNRSAAGLVVAVVLAAVIALVALTRPTSRWWVGLAVVVGAGATVTAAALILRAARAPAFPDWARTAFDPVRERLWQDAVVLWHSRPAVGSGPGSFARATTLSADEDTLAVHSSVLQVGAETGWVGVGLMTLVALAGLVWAARGRTPEAVVGCAGWTALLVHSTADHLLEFWPVVLLAGAVIGWAGATRTSEQLGVPEGERPVAG